MKLIACSLVLFVWSIWNRHAISKPVIGALGSNEAFVLDGEDVIPGEFPHQLLLERRNLNKWGLICGAVLISNVYALTAAHCVENTEVKRLRVVAGLHDVTNRNVSQHHPDFNEGPEFLTNDLAILTLSDGLIVNDYVQPIQWISQENITLDGYSCTISGWGKDESTNHPEVLQKVSISLISNQRCDDILSIFYNVKTYPGHLCGYEPVKGSCKGDSGGPLTCYYKEKAYLAGITSWNIMGDGVCNATFPSVFARISYFNKWIVENTP
ncbi:hypothetical protein HELRODRAFT_159293 [Helobdella robusta]|uniref:Peptidase S1 domain-containing protein n=1 Tax=Helobdella robusta TaxID=6412 RepID=T1ENU6_HELRO|nr:hypothetical protein HELRODRAFT_159293 [Helobdella robusta]ESO12707.1 hypothetical protein HELRODRAFT_159293 [Helobdella robusta]